MHFIVFLWIGSGLLVFTVFPSVLGAIWNIVWLQRWADALVYGAIIFLLYFVLLLLSKAEKNREDMTRMVRYISLMESKKTPITGKEVFIVRVYNEAPVLKSTLESIIDAGYHNILVIDDGSNDRSYDILQGFWDAITVVRHYENRGAWAALETGFEYIRRYGDVSYVITFDADGQHDISDAATLIDSADQNSELGAILGSRFIEDTQSNVPLLRRIILFIGRFFTLVVSGVYLTDTHNGFRLFTQATIEKIHLNIDTMAYASELIEAVKQNNISFVEVPVHISYSEYSLQKWQSSGNAIAIAMKFIWSKFFR